MKAIALFSLALFELMRFVMLIKRHGSLDDGEWPLDAFITARTHLINFIFLSNIAGIVSSM
jgi:hypothetical protein